MNSIFYVLYVALPVYKPKMAQQANSNLIFDVFINPYPANVENMVSS